MKRSAKSSRLTINRIASAGIRADKKGYAALTMGIMLSIFFITSLCLLATSVFKASENRAHALTGSQDAILMDASCTDATLLEMGLFTEDIGHACVTGKVAENNVYIGYYDERGAEMLQRTVLTGRMPEQPGEIAMEQSALDKMCLTLQVGDEVTLNIVPIDGTEEERAWTLVGILQDQADLMDISGNVGSSACLHWPSILLAADEPSFASGRTVLHRLLMLAPGVFRNETLKLSMRDDAWSGAVDGTYAVMTADGGVQFWNYAVDGFGVFNPLLEEMAFILGDNAIIIVLLMTLLAGALILATIVGISGAMEGTLSKRTETIGMLRCVGATRRQIRRIYGRESWLLALVTAPVSIALACGFACLVSLALPNYVAFCAPLWLLLPILLMTVVVVLIASSLPLRRASRVRPMSIMRDTGMLRKQKHLHSHTSFRLPTLMARRQTLFHPTRELGSGLLVSLMVLMVGVATLFGFHMLAQRIDFTQYAAYWLSGSGRSYAGTYTCTQPTSAYTLSDTALLQSLPLVKQVWVRRESTVNLLFEGETPSYFLPSYTLGTADQIALLPECPEDTYPEYYERCVSDLHELQEILNTDKKAINLALYVMTVDKDQLASYVAAGDIDMEALDAGREVLVYAPTFYYRFWSDGGLNIWMEKPKQHWDAMQENDYFTPGMTLELAQLWKYREELYDEDDSLEAYNCAKATVTVGAVLEGEFDHLGAWGMAIITTEKGVQSLGLMANSLSSARIYLSELPDEEGAEALARRIQFIGRRSGSELFDEIASNRARQREMAYAMLVLIAVAVVLFAVAVGMVSGSITRRIRADVRLIGTLRAVGADARTLVKCYTGPLWTSLLLGTALGLAALLVFAHFYQLHSMTITFTMYAVAIAAVVLFLSGVALVCRSLVTLRVREVTRRSIVENIREL